MRSYFPELRAKVARNWGEMGWDVSAGSGKTVVGGIGGVLGALGAIFDPEPLTKVGSGMVSASGFSYAGEGLSQIFNLGPAGGFNPLHEAFGAWGRMINGAEGEASSRYWLGWSELLLGASQLLAPTQAGKFRFGAATGVLGNVKGFGSAVSGDFATLRELVGSMRRFRAKHLPSSDVIQPPRAVASQYFPPIRVGRSGRSPLFYSIPNRSGGRVWVSTDEITQLDFQHLISGTGGRIKVIILTGTHGSATGGMGGKGAAAFLNESTFLADDLARFGGLPGVSVIDVTTLSSSAFRSIINSESRVICAWCYSERSRRVVKALVQVPGLGVIVITFIFSGDQ